MAAAYRVPRVRFRPRAAATSDAVSCNPSGVDSAEARRILVHGSTGPTPCGLGIRIVAGCLDFGVITVVLFWLSLFTREQKPDGSFTLPLWVYVVYVIWWLLYYGLFEYLWNGQTPGKRATRIKVVMGGGAALTRMAAVKRTLARPLDLFPYFTPYALGILWIIVTGENRRQRLGDKWAGTKVIPVDPPKQYF
jgi:uncharacterized RDD family membrane protein YckC